PPVSALIALVCSSPLFAQNISSPTGYPRYIESIRSRTFALSHTNGRCMSGKRIVPLIDPGNEFLHHPRVVPEFRAHTTPFVVLDVPRRDSVCDPLLSSPLFLRGRLQPAVDQRHQFTQ